MTPELELLAAQQRQHSNAVRRERYALLLRLGFPPSDARIACRWRVPRICAELKKRGLGISSELTEVSNKMNREGERE